jgi:cytochrome c-type biogenesis protein
VSPGDIVLSGSLLLALPIALAAGILTFVSPCVLPLVPGYLGYVSGSAASKSKMVAGAALFVLGFTAVFVSLGVLAGAAGFVFFARNAWVQVVLGALVVVLGLAMMGQFGWLQRTMKLKYSPKLGLAGAPLLGVVFAIGWTPCIGPTLSAVLVLASDSQDPLRGGILATVYSLGIGIPFVLIAAGFSWATKSVGFVKRHIRTFNLVGGSMLVLIGVLLMTGLWNQFILWIQEVNSGFTLPLYTRLLAQLVLASTHLDAHRAVLAVAVGGGRGARIDLSAAQCRPQRGSVVFRSAAGIGSALGHHATV